jgi:hypothetical protein
MCLHGNMEVKELHMLREAFLTHRKIRAYNLAEIK